MNIPKRMFAFAFLGLVSLLTGCATAPKFNTTTLPANKAMTSVYVYSFLDVRERELGPNYMREIEKQLEVALAQRGVKSKQLWFNRAPNRNEFALNEETNRGWRSWDSTTRVPVLEVMQSNAADELAFAPSHVMVVFPTDTENTGVGFAYTVTWRLMDMSARQMVWTATSKTNNDNFWDVDEVPVERARMLVTGLMQELSRNNLLLPSQR